jgi:hypothetical protein
LDAGIVVPLTLETPAKAVTVPVPCPRAILVVPIKNVELASLALAIEPANIVLVTVPESPVVTTVPVVAGRVMVVPVPAAALAARLIVPDVDPFKVIPVPPTTGDVRVTPAKVLTVEPRDTEVDPMVTDELDSLALAIDPASMAFVTVPVSPDPTRVPVAAGRVRVVVPAVALATTVIEPDVEPLNTAPVVPTVGRVRVSPETVEVVDPRVSVLDPKVMVELASFELAIAAPEAISALTIEPETVTLSQAAPS